MTGLTDPDGERSTFSYNDRYLRTRATYPGGLKLGFALGRLRRMCRMAATTGTLASHFKCDTAVSSPMELFSYDYTSPGGLDTQLRHTMTDKAGRETTYSYDKVARPHRGGDRLFLGGPGLQVHLRLRPQRQPHQGQCVLAFGGPRNRVKCSRISC